MRTVRDFTRFLEAKPLEEREYFLEFAAREFSGHSLWGELEALLTCLEYLQSKLNRFGIDSLIADYAAALDSDLAVVRDALRLSAPALRQDPSQLYTQLAGRIRYGANSMVGRLLAGTPPCAWLRDRNGALLPAAGAVIQNITSDAQSTIALTRDGRLAISAAPVAANDCKHVVKMWDLDTGEARPFVFTCSEPVRAMVTASDGKKVALLLENGTLTVVDVTFGAAEVSLIFPRLALVRVTEDGQRALVGLESGKIEVWDLASGWLICRPGSHRGVTSLVATRSGELAVSGARDGVLTIWSGRSWSSHLTFAAHKGPVDALALSTSGRWLVSASRDGNVHAWDTATGTMLFAGDGYACSAESHRTESLLLHETPEGLLVLATGANHTLKVWKWKPGAEGTANPARAPADHTFSGHQGAVTALAVNPDGERVMSASEDGTLKEWSLASGSLIRTLRGHTAGVHRLRITPDGTHAVSAATDNTVKVWTLSRAGGDIVEQGSPVVDLAIAHSGRKVITISHDESIRVFSLVSGRRLFSLAEQPFGKAYRPERQNSQQRIAITADGTKAVSLSAFGDLFTWRVIGRAAVFPSPDAGMMHRLREQLLFRFLPRRKWGFNADFMLTSDGSAVLSSTTSGCVNYWDFETGAILHSFCQSESLLSALSAVLETCHRPLNGCLGGILWLVVGAAGYYWLGWPFLWWFLPVLIADFAVGLFIYSYDPARMAKRVLLTSDDRQAVALSRSGIIKTWDLATGRLLGAADHSRLVKGKFSFGGIGASPGGRWVATTNAGYASPNNWTEDSAWFEMIVRDARTGVPYRKLCGSGLYRWHHFTRDEAHIAVATESDVTVWELDGPRTIGRLEGMYFSPDMTPDGSRLVVLSTTAPNELAVLDVPTRTVTRFRPDVRFSRVRLTADGKTVVAGDERGCVCFLDLEGVEVSASTAQELSKIGK